MLPVKENGPTNIIDQPKKWDIQWNISVWCQRSLLFSWALAGHFLFANKTIVGRDMPAFCSKRQALHSNLKSNRAHGTPTLGHQSGSGCCDDWRSNPSNKVQRSWSISLFLIPWCFSCFSVFFCVHQSSPRNMAPFTAFIWGQGRWWCFLAMRRWKMPLLIMAISLESVLECLYLKDFLMEKVMTPKHQIG